MKSKIFYIVTLLILFGCKSVNIEIPENYSILVGTGGGSLGLWQGYTIQSDGKILSWQGKKAGDNPIFFKNYDNKFPQKIWEIILKDSILKYAGEGNYSYGNTTNIIKINRNDSLHIIIWDPSIKNDTVEIMNSAYKKIFELIHK
ncbi:MAG TPA: hypothetical protein PKV40_03400 [Candidatus Kapabacteria bacterium]|nr:hypothetical protein [Candidatus Kapabacteria bacterium]